MQTPRASAIARAVHALGLSVVLAACTVPAPVVVGGAPPIPPPSELGADFGARVWDFGHQIDLMTAAPELAGPASLERALALLAAAIELIPAGDGLGAIEAAQRIRAAVVGMERAAPHPAEEAEGARAALATAALVLARAAYAPFPAAAGPSRELYRALARVGPGTAMRPVAPAWIAALRAALRGLAAIRAAPTLPPVARDRTAESAPRGP